METAVVVCGGSVRVETTVEIMLLVCTTVVGTV